MTKGHSRDHLRVRDRVGPVGPMGRVGPVGRAPQTGQTYHRLPYQVAEVLVAEVSLAALVTQGGVVTPIRISRT